MLEVEVQTKNWSVRVNVSIFAMCVVDCWKVWKLMSLRVTSDDCIETQKQFYSRLATELIDNNFDRIGGIRRFSREESNIPVVVAECFDATTMLPRSGISTHLTPTKRRRRTKDGEYTSFTFQGHCIICGNKTRYQCSKCRDGAHLFQKDNIGYLCHTQNGKLCFMHHLQDNYPD